MQKFLRNLFHWDHLLVTLTLFVFIGLFYALFASVDIAFLNPVKKAIANFSLSDMYYEVKQETTEPEMCPVITLVDMTDLRSRDEIAAVIDSIAACEPRVLGVDLIFESLREDLGDSRRLAEAAESAAPVSVFSCKLTDYAAADSSFRGKTGSFFAPGSRYASDTVALMALPVMEAYANVKSGEDYSYVRELTVERKLGGEKMRSMAATLAGLYTGKDVTATRDRLIDYQPTRFPVVRYDSIMACKELLRDRIVLLGTMHEEADMHYTPLGKMPGMEVQAYATLTLLKQKEITEVGTPVLLLLAFVISYLTQLLQYAFVRYTQSRKGAVFLFISESRLCLRILTFLWMGLLTWLSFLLYMDKDIYVSMALILLCIALVGEARGIYGAFVNTLARYGNRAFFKKSLYYTPEKSDKKKEAETEAAVASAVVGVDEAAGGDVTFPV